MITKITILLIFISLFYLTLTWSARPPPVRDWFREKYLKEIYDHQFTYIYETDYKDRVTCPEIHKPAVMSALSYILDITIRDILVYLSKFLPYISTSVYYIWQVFIVILYLVLTIPMTVMVLVLFFGQY
jgi:hypothetical protein